MLKRVEREHLHVYFGWQGFLVEDIETVKGNVLVQTTRSELDVTLYLNGLL